MTIKNKRLVNIFVGLFILLNIFFFNVKVYAFDVKVTNIKIVEQTGSITVDEPSIDENNVMSSNITFNKINDFVTYEIELKNNDSKKYVIEKVRNNNTNKNITVTTEYDKRYIEKESTNTIRIKIKYKSQLENVKEVSINDLMFTINLADEEGKKQTIIINNPKTGDGIFKYLILLIITVTALIFKQKNKKIGKAFLILPLIVLPFSIFASEKYVETLVFNDIKIEGVMLPYDISFNYENGDNSEKITKKYGDKLGELPIPEKTGYEFVGWFNGEVEVDENTVITENMDVKAKYSIILYSINYELNDGILENDNLTLYTIEDEIKLNNPSKLGYTFIGWTGSNGSIPSTSVTIEKGSTGTKEFVANYVANNDIPYKVIHKQMSLDGKSYTVKDEENFVGETNTEVTPNIKTYEGFKSPEEQTVTIKADGSTVVEYLYERKKYTFSIEDRSNINDKESTKDGEYYYETEIKVVANDKSGYTFVGWSNGETDKEITFKLEKDASISPVYSSNKNTVYKVIHKQMNLDGSGYTEVETELLTGETDKKVTPSVKTYEGFSSPSEKEITITGDGKAEVEYLYERKKYTFNIDDRTYIDEDSTANGEYYYDSEINIKAKERVGYTFTGWSNEVLESEYKFNLSENTTIYPTYTANKNTKYTVVHRLMSLDGSTFEEKETEELFGETDKEVNPSVKVYKGFTSPQVQSLTITGDGKAKIIYDYIRNSYMFSVTDRTYIDETNSNGDGEYYYGTEITVTAIERNGYDFKWSDGTSTYEKKFNIEKNVTLTPIYTTKGDTPYKVIHKTMDLDGSNYTVKDTDNYTGTTDTDVTPTVNIYEGFKSPSAQTVIIAGDGSTVVEYLYERKKYSFTLEDNTYIDQVNSTPSGEYYYGTEIKEIALDRNGYTFEGWSNGTTNKEISFILEENYSITPIYRANTNTPYKVIHKQMALDGVTYLVKEEENETGETDTKVTPPVKTYEGFTSPSVQEVIINGDGTAEVEYLYTRNKYILTIEDREYIDEVNSSINGEYFYDTKITVIALDRPGYTFEGWSNGETDKEYSFDLLKDTNLAPVYSTNKDTQYKVIHKLMTLDGKDYTEEDTELFAGETDTEVTPSTNTYTGFTSPEVQTLTITGDGKAEIEYLYKRNKYSFTVEDRTNIDEDNSDSNGEYYYESEITVVAKEVSGYTFTGWNDGTLSNIYSVKMTNNVVINPTYQPNVYTVIFDSNDSLGEMEDQTLTYDLENKLKANEFEKEGYHFKEWNTNASGTGVGYNDEELVKNLVPEGTITLYAQFEPNTDTPYKVIHKRQDLDGDYTIIEEENLTGTTDTDVIPNTKTYTGFTSPSTNTVTVNADGSGELEYYYDRNLYTVTFDSNEGSEALPIERYYEEQIGELPVVTKDGAVFIGWFTIDDEEVTTSYQIVSDITIYAKWSEASSTFITGKELNVKMKNLVNLEENELTYLTPNYNIASIEYFENIPDIESMTEDNIVSTTDSVAPIYMWYENGTIYWWSEAKRPLLNQDSSYMFSNLNSLEKIDFSLFKSNNLKNISYMFNNCSSIESIDLSNLNTKKVTNMSGMFYGCTNLLSIDFENVDTSNVTDMSNMFSNSRNLTSLDLSNFDTKKVTNMSNMFLGCSGLSSINLSSFDTSSVTNMSSMFSGCMSLYTLNLSNFNTSNVTDMSDFIYYAINLSNINLSSFDTSNVTNMSGMFGYCNNLINLDLSNFNTSNVTDMSRMFLGFSSIIGLDIRNFNTSKVTNMSEMFADSGSLVILDLSNFDTSSVINMTDIFSNSGLLQTIYAKDNFIINDEVNLTNMFDNNFSLVGGSGTAFDSLKIDSTYAHIDEGESNPGYFTNHYYIEFDSNGGEGEMNKQGIPLDKNAIIKSNEFIKEGYAFKEWNTKEDGTGTTYIENATINNLSNTRNDTIVLYAQWIEARATFLTGEEVNVKMKKLANPELDEISYLTENSNIISIDHSIEKPDLSLMTEANIVSTEDSTVPIYMWYDEGNIYWWSQDNYPPLNENSSYLFSGLTSLSYMTLSLFNSSNIKDISYMFMNDTNLFALDLSDLYTDNVTNMSNMFNNCSSLQTIYVSDLFTTTNVTNSEDMFTGALNLVGGSETVYNWSDTDKTYARVDEGESNPGYFTNHYYVTFDSNGGTGTMTNQGIAVGKTTTLKTNTYTKMGYKFKEWNTKEDGTGTSYSENASINLELQRDESITLYAQWEQVTLDKAVKVGDLISMTPSKESFDVDLNKTGLSDYSGDDSSINNLKSTGYTINPKELNLWRVIKVNDDGTIEAVSENVSSTDVHFYGKKGYANFVGYLNELAAHYENSTYTSGSRHMGYKNQTEFISNDSAISEYEGMPPWECNTGGYCYPEEDLGGGDELFVNDYNLVSAAYNNSAPANKVGTNTPSSYWIASRYYYSAYGSYSRFYFYNRIISTSGDLDYQSTHFFYDDWYDYDVAYPIRPIITFKPNLYVESGEGTIDSPIIITTSPESSTNVGASVSKFTDFIKNIRNGRIILTISVLLLIITSILVILIKRRKRKVRLTIKSK